MEGSGLSCSELRALEVEGSASLSPLLVFYVRWEECECAACSIGRMHTTACYVGRQREVTCGLIVQGALSGFGVRLALEAPREARCRWAVDSCSFQDTLKIISIRPRGIEGPWADYPPAKCPPATGFCSSDGLLCRQDRTVYANNELADEGPTGILHVCFLFISMVW